MTAYVKAAVALVLAALGFATGWVTHGWRSGAELATVKQQHADVLAGIARQTAKAAEAFRATETAWRSAIDKEAANGQTRIDLARRDAADARTERDRLQQQLASYRAAARGAASPGSATAGPTASDALDMLTDLFTRADTRAGELAEFADAAYAAGLTCERAYEALNSSR